MIRGNFNAPDSLTQYLFWAGPVSIKKRLKKSGPLLSDFSNLTADDTELKVQDGEIARPFQGE